MIVRQFQFTITDPESLNIIRRHAGPAVLDASCGTGYLCWLLQQYGIDTLAYDLEPPKQTWGEVRRGHSPYVARRYGRGRTLIISWPFPGDATHLDTLNAYDGERVIYIGEPPDSCGSPAFFEALERDWIEVGSATPVRWFAMLKDTIRVFQRKCSTPGWYLFEDGALTRNCRYRLDRRDLLSNHNIFCLYQGAGRLAEHFGATNKDNMTPEMLLWLVGRYDDPAFCTCGDRGVLE